MQIRIEGTASQNQFVWWVTNDKGETTKANLSIDIDDLMRKLEVKIYEELGTKRILESKTH